jgi:hypothetical protein
MKKSILIPVIGIFTALLFSCQKTPREEAAEAQVEAAEAEQVAARKAATADQWQEFREQSNIAIHKNEARIAELRAEAQQTGRKMDARYQASIDTLEQRNVKMQAKMDAYKNDASQDWEEFKTAFNHDSEDLRKSLLHFSENNKH